MRAYMRVKMDRPFDRNRHYFSPGGYEVKLKGGEAFRFDFNETEWGPVTGDPFVIEARVKDEDYETFPEIAELKGRLHEITEFVEFYVYTGEDGDECMEPVELLEFAVEDSGNEYRPVPESTDFIEVHDNLGEEKSKEYGSYDVTYEFKQALLDQVTKQWEEGRAES